MFLFDISFINCYIWYVKINYYYMIQELPFELKEKDEIWYCSNDFLVVYHPENCSLHFLDKQEMLKTKSSIICEDRKHAREVFDENLTVKN